MGTIIRFLESETEPPLLVMGTDTRFRPDIAAPWIADLPPFCPQKNEKIRLPPPRSDKLFVVTNIVYNLSKNETCIDIILVPEENYN